MDEPLQAHHGFGSRCSGSITPASHHVRLASRDALIDDAVAGVLAGRAVMTFGGERGAGKTTFVESLARTLRGRRMLVVQAPSGLRSPLQLQRFIGGALGIEVGFDWEPRHWLRAVEGETSAQAIVVLFDDADVLSATMLVYLWLLIRLFDYGAVKLHLVLAGGLGRWSGLEHPDLAGLRQLADRRILIMPLEDHEAVAYIDGKIRLAGGSRRRMMTDAALSELLDQACGVPGRLDELTESALWQAFQNRRRRVTVPVLLDSSPAEPDMIMPSSSTQPSWRSLFIVVLVLITAVGAGVVFGLSNVTAADVTQTQAVRSLPAVRLDGL